MKLKSFNPEVLPATTGRQFTPFVSIHMKSGMFGINGVACEIIGLKKGDLVEVYQDEEDPENWYLAKVKEGGWTLSQKYNSTGLFFCNKQLCVLIIDSVGAELSKPGVRLPLAGEPTKLGKQTLFGILAIAAKR